MHSGYLESRYGDLIPPQLVFYITSGTWRGKGRIGEEFIQIQEEEEEEEETQFSPVLLGRRRGGGTVYSESGGGG